MTLEERVAALEAEVVSLTEVVAGLVAEREAEANPLERSHQSFVERIRAQRAARGEA